MKDSSCLQVSGVCEGIYELGKGPQERASVIAEATHSAVKLTVEAGASANSCQVSFCGTKHLQKPSAAPQLPMQQHLICLPC